jgi:hypothetical protein
VRRLGLLSGSCGLSIAKIFHLATDNLYLHTHVSPVILLQAVFEPEQLLTRDLWREPVGKPERMFTAPLRNCKYHVTNLINQALRWR